MDMDFSENRYESFRIFQGRMLERYLSMTDEFRFVMVDANQPIETQQSFVRQTVASRVELATFVRSKAEAS
jgi:dTMP kinase